MEDNALTLQTRSTLLDNLGQRAIKWIREPNMSHNAALKERKGPHALCPIDNLIGDHKVHGLDLLPQGPDGREGDDASHAEASQGGNVGAVGDLVGRELVV